MKGQSEGGEVSIYSYTWERVSLVSIVIALYVCEFLAIIIVEIFSLREKRKSLVRK